FASALAWAIGQGFGVVNLSLSSRSESMAGRFHELADAAYFANTLLVCAANNVTGPSYPSLFAAVVSVAAHDVRDPDVWFYNPRPPVEFGAYGLDVDVAWKAASRIVATGNSFAAPHITGLAARVRATHPGATPFEVKTIQAATATATGGRRRGAHTDAASALAAGTKTPRPGRPGGACGRRGLRPGSIREE